MIPVNLSVEALVEAGSRDLDQLARYMMKSAVVPKPGWDELVRNVVGLSWARGTQEQRNFLELLRRLNQRYKISAEIPRLDDWSPKDVPDEWKQWSMAVSTSSTDEMTNSGFSHREDGVIRLGRFCYATVADLHYSVLRKFEEQSGHGSFSANDDRDAFFERTLKPLVNIAREVRIFDNYFLSSLERAAVNGGARWLLERFLSHKRPTVKAPVHVFTSSQEMHAEGSRERDDWRRETEDRLKWIIGDLDRVDTVDLKVHVHPATGAAYKGNHSRNLQFQIGDDEYTSIVFMDSMNIFDKKSGRGPAEWFFTNASDHQSKYYAKADMFMKSPRVETFSVVR